MASVHCAVPVCVGWSINAMQHYRWMETSTSTPASRRLSISVCLKKCNVICMLHNAVYMTSQAQSTFVDNMMTSSNGKFFHVTLALFVGNSPGTVELPPQRPVTRIFDVSFDLHLNKRWSKHAGDLRRYRAHYDVIVKTFVDHPFGTRPSQTIVMVKTSRRLSRCPNVILTV